MPTPFTDASVPVPDASSGPDAHLRRLREAPDDAAFDAFCAQQRPLIRAVIARILRGIASVHVEDAAQEALVRILRSLAGYRSPATEADRAAQAWINTIAQRSGIDWLRRHRRWQSLGGVEADESTPCGVPVLPPPEPDEVAQLERALGQLDAADRRLIDLRFFSRWSHQRIARACGVGEETSRMRIRAILQRLRQRLQGRRE